MPFNKGKYDTEYNMNNVTRKFSPFNKNNPEDVALLEWVNAKGKGKVTEYIKSLIREIWAGFVVKTVVKPGIDPGFSFVYQAFQIAHSPTLSAVFFLTTKHLETIEK